MQTRIAIPPRKLHLPPQKLTDKRGIPFLVLPIQGENPVLDARKYIRFTGLPTAAGKGASAVGNGSRAREVYFHEAGGKRRQEN